MRSGLEKLDKKRARYLEQHAEELITTDDLKVRLAEVEKQRAGLESQLAVLEDSERHFTDLEKLAHDFVLDLPDLLKDVDNLNENATADLYEDVYERLNLQAVVHEDGRIDVYFGAGGEAQIAIADLDNLPPLPPPPPPEDPVWDTWQEGNPILEPTGKSMLEVVSDNVT